MQTIAKKSIGVNQATGLEEQISVYTINIDSRLELITVGYCVEVISPTGVVVSQSAIKYYSRRNNPEQNDSQTGELITPANMKFDALRDSDVGKAIISMVQSDLNEYPEF